MTNKYTLIIERDKEGWFISEVVELPGCHTQAKSMDLLLKRTKEAIGAYVETEGQSPIFGEFVGVQQLEV